MLDQLQKIKGYPRDLRDAGRPDDPLFNRPIVHVKITGDGGIVERRDLQTDEIVRREVRVSPRSVKSAKEATPPVICRLTGTKAKAEEIREEARPAMAVDQIGMKAMETTAPAERAPATSTEKAGTGAEERDQLMHRVAELYNDGRTWREIQEELGLYPDRLARLVRRAKALGLVSAQRSKRQISTDSLIARVESLERIALALKRQLDETRGAAGPQTDDRAIAELLAELSGCKSVVDALRQELGIVTTGLVELRRRIEVVETREAEQSGLVERLVGLLELAMGQQRRSA